MKPAAKLLLSPNLESVYQHTVRRIHDQRRQQSLDLITLVLPRQREINRFRAQLSSVVNVALYEFLGLTRAILREANSPVTELESFAVRQVLHDILSDMVGNGQLTTFNSVWDKPGFISMLIQWLREMKSQQIGVENYQSYAESTGLERDIQLSQIYKMYSDVLDSNGLADREGMQYAACMTLASDPGLFAPGNSFFILGFDQFNPLQLTLIRSVAARKSNTCFYLVWDPDREPDNLALNRFQRTRSQLLQEFILDEMVIEDLNPGISPALKHLQKTLFVNPRPGSLHVEGDAVRLVAAPSREEEVRYSLRNIKHQLLRGVPPSEIALYSPHPESYIALVRAISRDYGIKLDITEHLSTNPAIVAFLNCISLFPEFEWSMTLEILRSPYVMQPWLTVEQVELLEHYTRLRPVVGGREQWLYALRADARYSSGSLKEAGSNLEKSERNHEDDLKVIEAGLLKFFDNLTPEQSGTPSTYQQWILQNILGDYPDQDEDTPATTQIESLNLLTGALEGNYPERDVPALSTLVRILINMSMAGRLMSKNSLRQMNWEEFSTELRGMINTTNLPGEKIYERVMFDRLEAGRGRTVKYLFVIGLGEGEFPAPLPPDPLYSKHERASHPLSLRVPDPADDASLWWQVINNCTTQLTLLRPYLDDNGADWSPSAYWDEVRNRINGLQELQIPIGAEADIHEAASLSELMAALAVNQAQEVPVELGERWGRALAGQEVQSTRLSREHIGQYEGFLEDHLILADLNRQFSANHIWSPSRLNSYNSCPYGFFVQGILEISALDDPEEGLDPLIRGILLHKILESYVNTLIIRGITPSPQTVEECLVLLMDACDTVLNDAPVKYGFLPGTLWRYEQQEFRRILRLFVEWECNQNGDPPRYTPYRTETRFGFENSSMLPVIIEADPHKILVHGVIDRIDRDQSGNLRVIDYKSGGTSIPKSEILKGTALQTALYAIAAESLAGEAERVMDSLYLHLPSRKPGGKLTFQDRVTENPDVETAMNIVRFTVAHIRNGEFPTIPANAGGGATACRDGCELAGICRVSRQGILKARQRGF